MKILRLLTLILVIIAIPFVVHYAFDVKTGNDAINAIRNGAVKSYYKDNMEFPKNIEMMVPKYIKKKPLNNSLMNKCQLELYFEVGSILANKIIEYKKDKGTYPDKLDDLVPIYIKKVPIIDENGGTFRYSKDNGNFQIGVDGYEYMYDKNGSGWIHLS